MRTLKNIVFVLLSVPVLGCVATVRGGEAPDSHPAALNQTHYERSRDLALRAEETNDPKEKARFAQEGIALAEECVMSSPEKAACYYYRAMNTGVYYSAHVVGYQTGIKSMIKDCKKVIALDEKFDHGGAYRMLGKLYSDMPETSLAKNDVRQDLDLATVYLKKAVQMDPAYPENHFYLAATLLAAGKKDEAFQSLANAETLVPQWKNHHDFSYWQRLNKDLSKKIR